MPGSCSPARPGAARSPPLIAWLVIAAIIDPAAPHGGGGSRAIAVSLVVGIESLASALLACSHPPGWQGLELAGCRGLWPRTGC
jgi:hypothetical protein